MEKTEDQVPLRVAFYLRVSTDEQVEKWGLSAQRSAIEHIIKSRGVLKNNSDAMVLPGKQYVYVDEGVSGTIPIDQRPAFARLKEDILNAPDGQRPFDIVAVYKIDRFARKLSILLDILNFFKQYDIEFISATESIDTSTPFGRAMLGIMGVIAELELDMIHDRTQKGREQAVQGGKVMGANAVFGYQKDLNGLLKVLEEEAQIVKRIYDLFIFSNVTPQKIADFLTQDQVLTPDASAIKYQKRKGVSRKLNDPYFWRAERIRGILSDEIYTGKEYYDKTKNSKPVLKKDWKLSPHRHESIVLSPIFELAQQRLNDLSERKLFTKKKELGNVYLLSGLLKCDYCRNVAKPVESEMMSWTGGKKYVLDTQRYSYHYACNRKNIKKFSIVCPVVPIPAEPLENYVIDFVKQLITDPKAVYEYQKQLSSTKINTKRLLADKEHYTRLLNELPRRSQNLLKQHEITAIDTPSLQTALAEVKEKGKYYEDKIKEIELQLSQVELSRGYEASFKLFSEKYGKSLDIILKDRVQLYDLIHMLIYQVVVYSRQKKDTDIIAGRKKVGQMIPDRIDIYLNLPQNLLQHLYTQRFGVKSDNLSG